MAECANGVVEWLDVLLLLVPFERQLRAEQFTADVASVGGAQGQRQTRSSPWPPGTHNTILGPRSVKHFISNY